MSQRRQRRAAELIHQEISRLIQFESKDPRLSLVTITGVDTTPDLREARIYYTVFGEKAEAREALAGLMSASAYFRRQLAQVLSLRYTPELTFKRDTSLEQAARIDDLLDHIKEEYPPSESEPPAEDNPAP
jgi:ribosome-binding factor A